MAIALPSPVSLAGLDRNDILAEDVAKIEFGEAFSHSPSMAIFRCQQPARTCMIIKKWLKDQSDSFVCTSGMLRMENQQLDRLGSDTEGLLLWVPGAAKLRSIAVDILVYLAPKEQRIRWYYSIIPTTALLVKLEGLGLITIRKEVRPQSRAHSRIFVFVRACFLRAYEVPHSPDYTNATGITDFAPDISDPNEALKRLYSTDALYSGESKDLSRDRYLRELTVPERELASLVDLQCAEYMLVKRIIFKEFYQEIIRNERKVTTTSRRRTVRTARDHQTWLEDGFLLAPTRAKKLVLGWRELGLLDETKFLPWAKDGGLLERSQ